MDPNQNQQANPQNQTQETPVVPPTQNQQTQQQAPTVPPTLDNKQKDEKTPMIRTVIAIVLLLFMPLFGLIFAWYLTNWPRWVKWLLLFLMIILPILLILLAVLIIAISPGRTSSQTDNTEFSIVDSKEEPEYMKNEYGQPEDGQFYVSSLRPSYLPMKYVDNGFKKLDIKIVGELGDDSMVRIEGPYAPFDDEMNEEKLDGFSTYSINKVIFNKTEDKVQGVHIYQIDIPTELTPGRYKLFVARSDGYERKSGIILTVGNDPDERTYNLFDR